MNTYIFSGLVGGLVGALVYLALTIPPQTLRIEIQYKEVPVWIWNEIEQEKGGKING